MNNNSSGNVKYNAYLSLSHGYNARWYHFVVAFLMVIIAYWGVTTNSDWGGYEYWFEVDASGTDKAFELLSNWFNAHNLPFRMLYRFHIVLIAFLYNVLFKRLKVNPIIFTLILLLYNYDAVGNQIRYFVGLPMALLSLYDYVNGKHIWAVLYGVIAFMFHSSLILLFVSFFFYYYILSQIRLEWRVIAILIVNVILFFLIHNTTLSTMFSDNYDNYLTSEGRVSSVIGGVYNLATSILYVFFSYRIDKEIKKSYTSIVLTNDYKYLYTCIMMGTVLFLSSIPTQIIATRMMNMAMMPIWLTFFIRANHINDKKISRIVRLSLIAIFVFCTLHTLGVFTGSDNYIYHIKEMLDSYTLR